MKSLYSRWQANFLTGLAIVLPGAISIAVVIWLFGTLSNFTDTLLIFLPRKITHEDQGSGSLHWYWSLFAFCLGVGIVTLIGRLARNFIGQKLIELLDFSLLRIPLLNKVYGAIKQINEAFTTSNKSAFKQVVLVEFPREGMYSVGFLTGEQRPELITEIKERVISVFVPTTPNPTSGFLVMVPESRVTKLDMSVAEGVKFIISLGAVAPEYSPTAGKSLPSEVAGQLKSRPGKAIDKVSAG